MCSKERKCKCYVPTLLPHHHHLLSHWFLLSLACATCVMEASASDVSVSVSAVAAKRSSLPLAATAAVAASPTGALPPSQGPVGSSPRRAGRREATEDLSHLVPGDMQTRAHTHLQYRGMPPDPRANLGPRKTRQNKACSHCENFWLAGVRGGVGGGGEKEHQGEGPGGGRRRGGGGGINHGV